MSEMILIVLDSDRNSSQGVFMELAENVTPIQGFNSSDPFIRFLKCCSTRRRRSWVEPDRLGLGLLKVKHFAVKKTSLL